MLCAQALCSVSAGFRVRLTHPQFSLESEQPGLAAAALLRVGTLPKKELSIHLYIYIYVDIHTYIYIYIHI